MADTVTEFNGKLAEPAKMGHIFDIEVILSTDAKSFFICLASDKLNEEPDADIALKIEVNLWENQIIANSRHNEQWDIDIVQNCSITYPMEDQRYIRIILKIGDNRFHISLNGEDKMSFTDRSHPGQLIKAIQIGGDVQLIPRMDHRQIYPKLWPPASTPPYTEHRTLFSSDAPIAFTTGHVIMITGRCFGDSQGEFAVAFKHAHGKSQLLHFNPRFNIPVVVRNSSIEDFGQKWGEEEREGGFPFNFNENFRIDFAFREKDFLIAVNSRYFCTYAYRDLEHMSDGDDAEVAPTKPNMLSNIVGPKCYGRKGTGIKILEIDHMHMSAAELNEYETLTNMECELM